MAFPPKNLKGKNPTGDKAFNGITKIVHGSQPGTDEDDAPAPSPTPSAGKSGKPTPKGGKMRYNTATHSFMKC